MQAQDQVKTTKTIVEMDELGLGYKLFNSYGIIYDENATLVYDSNQKNIPCYELIEKGFVLDKKLSKPISFELPVVEKLRTIFKGNENQGEQFIKQFVEYLLYTANEIENTLTGEMKKSPSSPFSHFEEVKNELKQIKVLNQTEFEQFCNDLLSKNKALPQDLLEEIYQYSLIEVGLKQGFTPVKLDLAKIKNKEAKLYFIEKAVLNNQKVNGYELIRFVNYLITGETLYIHKNKNDFKKSRSKSNESKNLTLTNVQNDVHDYYIQKKHESYFNNIETHLTLLEKVFSEDVYLMELASVYKNHLKTFIWLRNLFGLLKQHQIEQYKKVEKTQTEKEKTKVLLGDNLPKNLKTALKEKFKANNVNVIEQDNKEEKEKIYLDDLILFALTAIKSINKIKRLVSKGKIKQKDFSVKYHVQILTKSLEEQKTYFEKHKLSLKELLKMYYFVEKEKSMMKTPFKYGQFGCYNENKQIYVKDYKIRNGKLWIKNVTQPCEYNDEMLLVEIKKAIQVQIKEQAKKSAEQYWLKETQNHFSEKGKSVLSTKELDIILQTKRQIGNFDKVVLAKEFLSPVLFSDKNKLGQIYFGSQFKVQQGDQIGIVWQSDVDYDLSFIDVNNNKTYSFAYSFGDEESDFSHSGDCRTAGSEHITLNLSNEDLLKSHGVFYVNTYSRRDEMAKNLQFFIKRDGKMLFLSEKIELSKSANTFGYLKNGYFILDASSAGNEHMIFGNGHSFKKINLHKDLKDKFEMQEVVIDLASLIKERKYLSLEELLDKINIPYVKKSIFFKENEEKQDDCIKHIDFFQNVME